MKRAGEVKRTTQADNIDQALDAFFPTTLVDVDLESATPQRLDVRPLHARCSLEAYVIIDAPLSGPLPARPART